MPFLFLGLRLISRQLNAIAMPFVFARYILTPRFFDSKYHGDPVLSRLKSLNPQAYSVRGSMVRDALAICHPIIAVCRRLKDLE